MKIYKQFKQKMTVEKRVPDFKEFVKILFKERLKEVFLREFYQIPGSSFSKEDVLEMHIEAYQELKTELDNEEENDENE